MMMGSLVVIPVPPLSEEQKIHVKEWLEALRSGDYKQITGRMRTPDGFCCMGVAVDLMGVKWEQLSDFSYSSDLSNVAAPRYNAWKDWFGFGPFTSIAQHTEAKVETTYSLSELNDKLGLSFEVIADIVEEAVFGKPSNQ